jgi:hypothetical protein
MIYAVRFGRFFTEQNNLTLKNIGFEQIGIRN